MTGERVAALLTSVSGSSASFVRGIVAYNIDQKVTLLGVSRDVAEPVNCVSRNAARQMADGVRGRTGATIGIATTGYAEYSNGQALEDRHDLLHHVH